MKKIFVLLVLPLLFVFASCSSNGSQTTTTPSTPSATETPSQTEGPNTSTEDEATDSFIYASANNQTLGIKLEDNVAVAALLEKLKDGDVTIAMHDYGGFEKVGGLGFNLPTEDKQISTVTGDVVLYQGSQLCIHYDSNPYSYTKIGRIDLSKTELLSVLGDDDVEATLTLESKK